MSPDVINFYKTKTCFIILNQNWNWSNWQGSDWKLCKNNHLGLFAQSITLAKNSACGVGEWVSGWVGELRWWRRDDHWPPLTPIHRIGADCMWFGASTPPPAAFLTRILHHHHHRVICAMCVYDSCALTPDPKWRRGAGGGRCVGGEGASREGGERRVIHRGHAAAGRRLGTTSITTSPSSTARPGHAPTADAWLVLLTLRIHDAGPSFTG